MNLRGLSRFSDLGKLFADKNYRWYVTGNFASSVGIWIQRIAIGWLVWELTHSPSWLGIIALAEAGPTIIFGFLSGALLDRFDVMRVLRMTQLLTILYSTVLAAATLAGQMNIWLLLGLVLFRGSVFSLNRPARQTIVYSLAGRTLMANALAFNATVFNTSKFIGPAAGGVTLLTLGAGGTFLIALGLQLVFTLALFNMNVPASPIRNSESRSIIKDVSEGFAYVVTHPGIRLQFALMIAVSFAAKPLVDLLPGFSGDVFRKNAEGLAMLYMMHGIGAVSGGIWLSLRSSRHGLVNVNIITIIILSMSLMVFASNGFFLAGCALLFLVGLCSVVIDVTSQTLIQTSIRSRYRGRTMSTYGMIAQGVPALGALAMGFAAEFLGLQWPVLLGGSICLAIGIAAWLLRHFIAIRLGHAPEDTGIA